MKMLITAGGTRAHVDTVRCFSTIFTGKTGATVATTAWNRGHTVTFLTSNPDQLPEIPDQSTLSERRFQTTVYSSFDDLTMLLQKHVRSGEYDVIIHTASIAEYLVAGAYTPDAPIFMAAYLRHWGMDRPLRPLAHNLLFSIPALGDAFGRLGLVPASPSNAAAVLERGESLLVYPGGDYESQRPYLQSHLVDFGGRKGFIRLALEKRVPVIPFVCHGSNETVVTVTRGEKLAKLTGLTYLTRTKVLPFRLSVPFGLVPSGLPYLPLPSKITIEVGHPMSWQGFRPEDAQNPALVDALYDDIVGTMQRTLTGLYVERPNPYARRSKRTTDPQHSPAPSAPASALALRQGVVAKPLELASSRLRNSRPPEAKTRRTSAA